MRSGQCEPCCVAVRRTPESGPGQDTQEPLPAPAGPAMGLVSESTPFTLFFLYL